VVIVLVILLIAGVFDSGGGSGSSEGNAGGGPTAAGGSKQPTQAVLKAVDGSAAVGRALFGRSKNNVVLLFTAKGLRPSPPGRSYTVSVARSPTERLPLVATKVGSSGTIAGRFQVAPQVLGLLASGFDEMELSLVSDGRLRVALAQARKSRTAPAYGGEKVLSGRITGPIVEVGGEG
jgi:hypothetical protein